MPFDATPSLTQIQDLAFARTQAPSAAPEQTPEKAFEALFVGEIFKAMRATVHESDSNFGKSVFTSMLDEQLAQHVADSGGLGLTAVLKDELNEKNLKV